MSLFRWLINLFSGRKTGYSIKGFWGQTKHFNKDGVQVGYSVKWFWGGRRRYDMNGNLVSYSVKNFWGGYNIYDAQGNLIRRTRKNFFGGYNTYDKNGKKIGESYKNIWDGYTHYDVDESAGDSSCTYNYEVDSVGTSSASVSATPIQTKTGLKKQAEVKQTQPTYNVSTKEREGSTYSANSYSFPKLQEEEGTMIPEHSEESRKDYEKYVAFKGQDIDRTVEYYESVTEYLEENKSIGQYVKILVFEYQSLKEFPAIAYVAEDLVRVVPLIHYSKAFEFSVSELKEVKMIEVTDLDMSAIDNEFITFGISGLAKEFEALYPDYQLGGNGMCRIQCEFPCGLIVTEKSLEQMRELLL